MTKRLAVLAVLAVAAVGTAQAAGYDPIETRQAGQDLLAGTFNGGSPKDQREWYDNVRVWY